MKDIKPSKPSLTSSARRVWDGSPKLRTDLPFPAAILANQGHRATLRFFAKNGAGLSDDLFAQGNVQQASEARVTWGLGVAHFMWEENGSRIYEFPPALAQAFMETEFPLRGTDVPFPLQSFYIRARDCGLKVRAYVTDTVEDGNPLDGFYVTVIQREIVESTRRKVADEGGPINEDLLDATLLHVLAIGAHPGGDPAENSFADFVLKLDAPLEEALTAAAETAVQKSGQNAHDFIYWLRVIVGACAYLAQEKPDLEERMLGPTAAQRERAKSGSKADRRALQEARLNVTYYRAGWREKLHEHFSGTEAQRKLTRRHIVRGHFRQQPHGEGRKERKLVWIKPFWKGPDWAEVAANVVRVR